MLLINPFKPFYVDEQNKILRMGNFENTGKEIEYEDINFLKIFEYLKQPTSKTDLVNLMCKETGTSKKEINEILDYLISENFIIYQQEYQELINDHKYGRQNMYFSMISEAPTNLNAEQMNKRILILGLGGVGANVAQILHRAGFKNFTIVDFDLVEESNLIRQFPYTKNDIDKLKTDVLADVLQNEDMHIKKINKKIEKERDIICEIRESDFVLCTLDKPFRVIRRLINSICIKEKKPVLFAGFAEHVAMIGPFVEPTSSACLICNEPKMTEKPLYNVTLAPSYGPLCSVISSLVANEIINYFVKFNNINLIGKTLMFNMISYKMDIIEWSKNDKCKECGINVNQ